jgi:hypothetical protein
MPVYRWQVPPASIVPVLDARSTTAASCLTWAVAAVDSLHYLQDLDAALPGTRLLPGGHDALTVDLAHARWAAGTAMTALDLCAAAIGHLYRLLRGDGQYHDMGSITRAIKKAKPADRARASGWINPALADPDFGVVQAVRHPLTHRTVARHLSVTVGAGEQRVGRTLLEVAGLPAPLPVHELVRRSRGLATRHVGHFVGRVGQGTI